MKKKNTKLKNNLVRLVFIIDPHQIMECQSCHQYGSWKCPFPCEGFFCETHGMIHLKSHNKQSLKSSKLASSSSKPITRQKPSINTSNGSPRFSSIFRQPISNPVLSAQTTSIIPNLNYISTSHRNKTLNPAFQL